MLRQSQALEPIPDQLRLCWLPLPFQEPSANSGSDIMVAKSRLRSETTHKGCKVAHAAEVVWLCKTTNPISIRHVFGYKLGKQKIRQKCLFSRRYSSYKCVFTSNLLADANSQNTSMWDYLDLGKDSSVSALKMPESPGIYLNYCSL